MATVPEVKIKISGDPKGFSAAVKTVQGSLGALSGSLTRVQALSASALNLSGLGGAASIAGLIAIAKSTADIADEMGKLAQRTGVGVEALSQLVYAADLSGASVEDLSAGLRRLGDDAGDGGKNLKAAGIALLDAGGKAKTTEQLFGEVADLFASLPDGIQKTNLAVTLFGKNIGAQLTPLLNLGSKGLKELADESDRFGKTITASQAAAAEEFNDNLTRLQALAQGAARELGASLIPAMNDLALAFLQAIQDDRQIGTGDGLRSWADNAARAIAFVVDGFDGVSRVVEITGKAIGAYAAALGAVVRGDLTLAKAIINELGKDIREIADRKLFSSRLAEQQAEEVRASQTTADIQKKLTAAIIKEHSLRLKASQSANSEELKGAERLKAALQAAWQASIDGARKAREEAKDLLKQSGDAKTTAGATAKDRLSQDKTPEQNDREARTESEKLRSEANFAASSAVVAAFQGRLAAAKTLADEAITKSAQALELSKKILNNRDAASLIEKLGVIKSDALKAQSIVKEKEAVDLEKTGEGQNKELNKVEERIKALKADLEKPVNLTMDITAAEKAVKTLQQQLDEMKSKTITVTVNTVAAGAAGKTIQNMETGEIIDLPTGPVTPRGFASGGYTGAGGKFQPAGIVHAGEYVLRQEVVRQKGMRSLLDRLNVEGINAVAKRGYANGGLVADNAAQTPINLNWPDGSTSRVSAESSVAKQIEATFRRAALARGGRRS
ncbi:hypothetical protein [Hydrogenophaga sp.]|uniref:hypothetical protein n=1 Tax=Hydrogenophaga sp. TaxID=1904254 RepID=UPI002721B36A|nr:hypothetical protein [Hydrogenophaga sp.]MDO9438559.1 hypothetical protein [Hydrogenophaga sp.]